MNFRCVDNYFFFILFCHLRRALKIRQQPLEYKNHEEIKKWLSNLGSMIQKYADVLEAELSITRQI